MVEKFDDKDDKKNHFGKQMKLRKKSNNSLKKINA